MKYYISVLMYIITIGIFSFNTPYVYAEVSDAGVPGSFLNLGTGARSLGMGGAFVGRADDASAIYWNSAGLAQLPRKEATFFFVKLWEDTDYTFLAYGHPVKNLGTFGGGIIVMNSQGFERRDNAFDDPSEFGIIENAIFLSYGRSIWDSLSAGISFKHCAKKVMDYSGEGVGADIGLLYQVPFIERLKVGMNIQNIIPPQIQLKSVREQFATNLKLGFAYKLFSLFKHWEDSLSIGFDLDKTEYRDVKGHIGVEYWYLKKVSVRFGIDKEYPAFGLGLIYRNFEFDWAMAPHDLGDTHRVSVSVRFGKWLKEEGKGYSKWQAKKRAKEYYFLGERHYNRGEYAETLTEWEKSAILDPDNKALEEEIDKVRERLEVIVNRKLIEKHIGKAYAYYQEGELIESLEEWKEVARLNPDNQRAQEYIDKINTKLSKKEKEKYLKKLREKKQAKIVQYMVKGDRYYDKNKYQQAITEWEKVLRINPKHQAAKENIAQVKKKIRKLLDKHYKQGVNFYNEKETIKAIAEFKTVLKLEPRHKTAKDYLEKAKQQLAEEPEKVDKKVVDKLYYQAADLYLKGEYKEAMKTLNEILKVDPTYEPAEKLLEKTKSLIDILKL